MTWDEGHPLHGAGDFPPPPQPGEIRCRYCGSYELSTSSNPSWPKPVRCERGHEMTMEEAGFIQVEDGHWASSAPDVTLDQVAHVLWSTGNGGYAPGSFITKLLEAWRLADRGNQLRLARGFPEYGYLMWLQRSGQVDRLRELWSNLLNPGVDAPL